MIGLYEKYKRVRHDRHRISGGASSGSFLFSLPQRGIPNGALGAFVLVLCFLFPHSAHAAIAFDAANKYTACVTGTSCTYSYTIGAVSNPFLACETMSYTTNPGATTMTYNGVSMTEAGTQQTQTQNGSTWQDTFYATAPSTGTHNIVITTTNSLTNGFYAHCASYSGVAQSSPIEGIHQQNNAFPLGSVNVTVNVTTTSDNDWIWGDEDSSQGNLPVSGTNTTVRSTGSDPQGGVYDSNAAKTPAGTYSLNFTNAGTNEGLSITAFGIKPVATAPTSPPFTPFLNLFIGFW